MQEVKDLDKIGKFRRKNRVVESLQVKVMQQELSKKYNFSSENSRPRSSGEKKILERFRENGPVGKI